jgi:hypothetical protein
MLIRIRIMLVTLTLMWIQLSTLIQIRIQLPKMMRIRIRNTGTRVCPVPDLLHCIFFPLGFHLTTKIFPPYADVMM